MSGLDTIVTNEWVLDEATCYRVLSTGLLSTSDLRCEMFKVCPKLTAKVRRLGLEIVDVPIHYESEDIRACKKLR
jgi:hypothetical protein